MSIQYGRHQSLSFPLQAFDLYHFTDEVAKDMHPSRHWYAGWDLGRRLLLVLAYYIGVYLDASLLAVCDSHYMFYISVLVLYLYVCGNVIMYWGFMHYVLFVHV